MLDLKFTSRGFDYGLALLCSNLSQVAFTSVPTLPSCIIWHWPMGGDELQLGRQVLAADSRHSWAVCLQTANISGPMVSLTMAPSDYIHTFNSALKNERSLSAVVEQ